jgi:predicted small lipoprotein YifL
MAAVVGVLATLSGTGCGQSGPLFLPAESPAASTAPAATATDDGQVSGQADGSARAGEDEDDEKTP